MMGGKDRKKKGGNQRNVANPSSPLETDAVGRERFCRRNFKVGGVVECGGFSFEAFSDTIVTWVGGDSCLHNRDLKEPFKKQNPDLSLRILLFSFVHQLFRCGIG